MDSVPLERTPEMQVSNSSQVQRRTPYHVAVLMLAVVAVVFAVVIGRRLPHDLPSPAAAAQPSTSPNEPSAPPTAPATPPVPTCPETSLSKSRQRLAETLQTIYKNEGRMLTVTVQGDNCDVLQLAGMLAEGNHTMEAAQRETINCDLCMLAYKKTKFKTIRFLGPDLNWEYSLK